MKIDNVPIIGKIMMILGLFGVLVIGSTVFVTAKMRGIDDSYSALSDHQALSGIMLSRSNTAMRAIRRALAELMISSTEAGNQRALQDIASERDSFNRFLDAAAKASPAHAEEYAGLKRDILNVLDQRCAKAIKAGGSSTTNTTEILESQSLFLTECSPFFLPVAEAYDKALETNIMEARTINEATSDVTSATIRTTWMLMIGGLALAVVGAFLATRAWISGPLTRIAGSMSGLAAGDLEVAVVGAGRSDEVGTIARVAQVFKDAARDKLRLENDAVRQRQAADDERQRNDASRAASMQEQARVVQAIASGLERLSSGSLVFRIDETFAAEYEKLRVDFNAAMGKLQETMTVVSANTSTIRSGTDEISSAADDLSKRTEQQAASLEETSAALDEVTATVRKTAEGASHARSVVGRAKQDAEQSGDVVRQAVEAMSSIERSSQQIGQIIGVIDEIAFQTNLLALNAGVEAARAGEAGRGFAVVASEVRALAQRSAEAAKEIKTLISASTAQVEQGVELVGQTGKVLDRIVGQVNEINTIVVDIAASAQEQATGLNQINTAINQMDQVTQQNAAMVEESTAASRNLSQETEQLAHLIGRFDVGNAGSAIGSSSRRSGRPAAPTRSATPVPALRTVGTGGAARKADTAADHDWQEF